MQERLSQTDPLVIQREDMQKHVQTTQRVSIRGACKSHPGQAGSRNEQVYTVDGQYFTSDQQQSPFVKCKAMAATNAQLDVASEAHGDEFDEKKIAERCENLYRFRLQLRYLRIWNNRLKFLSQACCHDRRRALSKALYALRWAVNMHCAQTDAVERRRSAFLLYQSFYQWKNHYESRHLKNSLHSERNTEALRKRLIQPSRSLALMTTCSTWRNLHVLRTAVIHHQKTAGVVGMCLVGETTPEQSLDPVDINLAEKTAGCTSAQDGFVSIGMDGMEGVYQHGEHWFSAVHCFGISAIRKRRRHSRHAYSTGADLYSYTLFTSISSSSSFIQDIDTQAVGPHCEQQKCAVKLMKSRTERHRLNLSFSTWVTRVRQQQTARAIYNRTLLNRGHRHALLCEYDEKRKTVMKRRSFVRWSHAVEQFRRAQHYHQRALKHRVLLAWHGQTVSAQRRRYREAWFQYSSEMRLQAAVFMQWRKALIQGQQRQCALESLLIIYQSRVSDQAFQRWRTAAAEWKTITTFNNKLLNKYEHRVLQKAWLTWRKRHIRNRVSADYSANFNNALLAQVNQTQSTAL
ncbi:hypothetical protein ROHU_029436 [Labeo rohita]|uniref:Uncharacterized protein n=1 Tax=Labeo rohita TaxID=84645 RepID=A0A498M4R6_LABRO|nr:hypothetical protein ROHU_029436 [Labeo rohita]